MRAVLVWISIIAVVLASEQMQRISATEDSGNNRLPQAEDDFATTKFSIYSVQGLQELMELDWQIARAVWDHVFNISVSRLRKKREIYKPHPAIQQYLLDFSDSAFTPFWDRQNKSAISVGNKFLNPLAIFRTLWRFERFVSKWWEDLNNSDADPVVEEIVRERWDPKDGPTMPDLDAAAIGLLLIQRVYGFPTKEVSEGFLAEMDTGLPLNWNMSITMAHQAALLDYPKLALEWAEVALQKVKRRHESENQADNADLRSVELEVEIYKRMLKLHQARISRMPGTERQLYEVRQGLDLAYRRLCAGKIEQVKAIVVKPCSVDLSINKPQVQGTSAEEKKTLFCWLETAIHPSWKIGPLKAEFLSWGLQGEVVLYHDVLSERLLLHLPPHGPQGDYQKGTTSVLKTGRVVDPRHKLSSQRRVDPQGPEAGAAAELWSLINRLTGLRVGGFNKTQVTGYSPGGHYAPHLDSFGYDAHKDQTQMATFLGYWTDVEKGGETVFPSLKVSAVPKRGSAIFWYNVLSSGKKDTQTGHASCPIIFGQKQIVTVWARYHEQRHLQCHKDPQRRVEVLVNGRSKYPTT